MSVFYGTHFFFSNFLSDITKSQKTGHCDISDPYEVLLLCFHEEFLGNIIVSQCVSTPRVTI